METYNLILNKQKEIDYLLKENINTSDKERKETLEKALKINNTKKDLVLEYLLLLKRNYKNDFNYISEYLDALKMYINHIPKNEFNSYFSDTLKKEHSSIEKINLIFDKIKSQNWSKCDFNERKKCLIFFYNCIKDNKNIYENTSPITWENEELYIYTLLDLFLEKIHSQIKYYENNNNEPTNRINKINELLISQEKKYQKMKNYKYQLEMMKLIEKTRETKRILNVIEGKFFTLYLYNFRGLLFNIEDYLKSINFDKREDKDIFDYIMWFFSYTNFENFNSFEYWRISFRNVSFEENKEFIELYNKMNKSININIKFSLKNENELIVTFKDKIETIKNIQDYTLNYLCQYISTKSEVNYIELMKYIKIPKLNKNIYIKTIYEEWKNFNNCIFNSNTIKTLYNSLFKNQINLIEQDEIDNILNNIIYFVTNTNFVGLTNRKTLKIYEYAALTPINDSKKLNIDLSKTIFLAYCLCSNQKEILGHFNIGYQNYNHKKEINYESPIVDKSFGSFYAKSRNWFESGENIEIKLYGRVLFDLTLKEALFILNYNNYMTDYQSFQKNFKECNKEKLRINNSLKQILKSFNIESDKLPYDDENYYSIDKNVKKYSTNNIHNWNKGKHPFDLKIDPKIDEDNGKIDHIINLLNNMNDN